VSPTNTRVPAALALALTVAAAGVAWADPPSPANLAAPSITGAPARDVPGYEALTSGHEAKGDARALLESLAAAVAKDPASGAASLALMRIGEVREDAMAPCAALAPALEKAIAGKMPDAAARDRAARLLAELRAEAGDWDGARAAEAARGSIRSWLVVGPFGFTPRALHDRVFAVESSRSARAIDPGEAFEGSNGSVRWTPVELGPLADGVTPAEHIRPSGGAAYALAQLRAPAGTRAVVTVACAGSFKAWWNGALVLDVDRSSGWFPTTTRLGVVFGDGAARLLLKVTSASSEVAVRVTAADGSGPVAGLAAVSGGRIEPMEGDLGSATPIPAARAPGAASAYARAADALELAEDGLTADALPVLEAAAIEEKSSAHLAFLYARMLEEADHIPEAKRLNDARAWVQKALARDPRFVPALERNARFIETDGKPVEAMKALRALAREHPASASLRRSAYFLARRQRWENESLEEAQALLADRPDAYAPRVLLADHYLESGNRPRALALYREALARDRNSPWIEDRVAALLSEAGVPEEAITIRKALAARYPDEPARLQNLAELLVTSGRVDDAVELLSRAAEMRGGEPSTYERIAAILIEAGRRKDALPWLERVLAAEPGDFATRRMLAVLRGLEWDFSKPYEIDAAAAIAGAPSAEKYPKANSICLIDQTVSRIHRDGSKTDIVHQTYKILNDEGVSRYHTVRIPGQLLEIRTIATDGKVYEPIFTESTSEILMPKLTPGAVIDYRYRAVASGRAGFQLDAGQFYFKDPQLSEPCERSQYVVIVEDGIELETIARNMPSSARVEKGAGATVYRWEVRDSDRIDEEPFMPGRDEILPSVQIIGRRTWDDVAELYRERFLGRTRLTPELRAKAAELTAGLSGDAAKARRLYDFVLDHVRGDQGPGEASEIFVEKAGHRSVLLRALLDAAGVPSRFAMSGANPRLSEVVVWDPPRPELMPFSALVVEPRDGPAVWVLEGGRFLPYGMIFDELQGAPAMLLSRSGGELGVVPEAPIEATATRLSLRIALEGRAGKVQSRLEMRAPQGYRLKDQVATASKAQLKTYIESQANESFRGAKLTRFDFPGVDKPGVPFTIEYEASVPELVTPKGEKLAVKTGLTPLGLTGQLGGDAEREHPMLLRVRQAQEDVVEIDLGTGYVVESLPQNLLVAERFGTYSLTFEARDGRVRVRRWFALVPSRVESDEYDSVLRFCREVDAAELKWIEVRGKS